MDVVIRSQWNAWPPATVLLDDLTGLHWGAWCGGEFQLSSNLFIMGYVLCDRIKGEFEHSCRSGEGPHRVEVCMLKRDNPRETYKKLLEIAGPKPETD